MSIGASLLPEFDQEMAITRRVLERVPTEKGLWKPHPKSFPVGHLAQLVSRMPGWIATVLTTDHLDLAQGMSYSFEPTQKLLRDFDENVRGARLALAAAQDAVFDRTWELRHGERVLWSAPVGVVLRNFISHLVHHRAQLGVYLRLLDVPVPAAYGPSADEQA